MMVIAGAIIDNLKLLTCFGTFYMLNMRKMITSFAVPILAAGLFLAGCSGSDVQFEGKIFEAAGLTGINRREEAKVRERAPIVLPPGAALPEPGKRKVAAKDVQWPDDPDVKARKSVAEIEVARQKYCSEVGRNRQDPYFDEEKAAHCGGLLTKAMNNAFGRAPDPDVE